MKALCIGGEDMLWTGGWAGADGMERSRRSFRPEFVCAGAGAELKAE